MLLSGSWENLPNRETEAQTTQGLAQGVWPPANLAGNITNPANIAGSWIHLGPSGQPSPPPEILGGLTAERGFSQRRPLPVPRLYSPSAQQTTDLSQATISYTLMDTLQLDEARNSLFQTADYLPNASAWA